jgi:hypothetical protein
VSETTEGTTCVCCARALQRIVERVECVHVRTGERRSLVLCPRCLEKDEATWRLSWRSVAEVSR